MMQLLSRSSTFVLALTPSEWRDLQLRSMQSHFQRTDPHVYYRIAVAVMAIAAIFLVMKLVSYWQNRRLAAPPPQPFALFRRVQTELGLSRLDRWELWRMAKTIHFEHPTALLISPVLFDRAVAEYGKNRSIGGQSRLTAIRLRLFGKAVPHIEPAAGSGDET